MQRSLLISMAMLCAAIFGIGTFSNSTTVVTKQTQPTKKPKVKADAKAPPSIPAKPKF